MTRRTHGSLGASRTRTFAFVFTALAALLGLTTNRAAGQAIKLENENVYGFMLWDLMEVAPGLEGRPLRWDMIGSVGKDYDRFWIKSEGDLSTTRRNGEMEFQALYSHLVAPYWELQVGARLDLAYASEGETQTRWQFVLGLEGLAPYWFELEPAILVSQAGEVSAELVGSYDLFVTQRMVLRPRVDLRVAVQEVPEWGISNGLNGVTLGARLRYEIEREFAPYVGVSWTRLIGGTADLAKAEGDRFSEVGLVAGFRVWR